MTELNQRIETYRTTANELKRLMGLRLSKTMERDQAKAKAVEVKTNIGAALLVGVLAGDESGADQTIHDAALISTRAEALAQIVTALDKHIADQQQAVRVANANCMRADGAALILQADERQKRTDELMAPLVEWEGVAYAPVRPEQSPATMAQKMIMMSGTSPVIPIVGLSTRSITEALREKGNALIKCADLIERGEPIPTDIYFGKKLVDVPNYLELATLAQEN
jgi:hypothetical protein